jgi:hypothetical protein
MTVIEQGAIVIVAFPLHYYSLVTIAKKPTPEPMPRVEPPRIPSLQVTMKRGVEISGASGRASALSRRAA